MYLKLIYCYISIVSILKKKLKRIITNSTQSFPQIQEERALPSTFYEASVTLTPKQYRVYFKKKSI